MASLKGARWVTSSCHKYTEVTRSFSWAPGGDLFLTNESFQLGFRFSRLAALPDRQATFLLYKLMVNQPSANWPLFLRVSSWFCKDPEGRLYRQLESTFDGEFLLFMLQALLSRNARLPVTIVKYGGSGKIFSRITMSENALNWMHTYFL